MSDSNRNRHCTTMPCYGPLEGSSNKAFLATTNNGLKKLVGTLLAVSLSLTFLAAQQTFTIPVNGTISLNILNNCDTTSSFISDTSYHHLYTDSTPRSDTMSICPQNRRQRVFVNFSTFDLAALDSLFVYDGKIPNNINLAGKAGGVGTANAFGSWVKAHCSPDSNRTGCLSFIFKTNGDGIGSRGFEATVGCENRNFKIEAPAIHSPLLKCSESYQNITLPAATITSDCDTIFNDSTYIRVRSSSGKICLSGLLSKKANNSISENFAIGTYEVEYILKQDTSIRIKTYFSVQARNLVCNDTLNVGMNKECQVWITPDMILEAECPVIPDTMQYEITLSIPNGKPNGKIIATGSTKTGYPIIPKELIEYCGQTVYTATLKRVYYDSLNLSICNDGKQSDYCSTILRFEDKIGPQFLAPVQCDTIFACNASMTPESLGLIPPLAVDNCDSAIVSFAGFQMLHVPTTCDTIQKYLAIWEAVDYCSNISKRKDTLKIFRPGLDKIIPTQNIYLSCGMDDTTLVHDLNRTGVPGLQVGFQENGQFIATDTIPLDAYARICNYSLSHQDTRINANCSDKYFRYWQLLDWCKASTLPITIDTQVIEFRDTLAPEILCGDFSTLEKAEFLDLLENTCQMTVSFPLPKARDKCAEPIMEAFTVEVLEEEGWWLVARNLREAGALECDTFRVGYRAYDSCNHFQPKEDTCYRYFIIRDITGPTAICHDVLNVNLGGGRDTAFIHSDAIDSGSWDMCEVDTILARRTICSDISTYQGPDNQYVIEKIGTGIDAKGWTEKLPFTCCDVHHPVFVELLVIDKKGNYNTCWTQLNVEDKVSPICQPLPPVNAFCDTYNAFDLGSETDANQNEHFDEAEWLPMHGTLAQFYNQKFGDPALVCEDDLNCNELLLEQEYQLIRLTCGEINIKRRYRVIDYGKNQSMWEEQDITLAYRPNWKITFPIDIAGDCDATFDNIPAQIPIINGNCDQVSWDYEDEIFETADDIFVKVIRTYSIINWCTYQPGEKPLVIERAENHQKLVDETKMISSDSLGAVGFIQYTQIMKVIDEEKPFLIMGKVDTIILGKGDAAPNAEEDQTLGSAPFECDAVKRFQVFARDCNAAISENLNYGWEFLMDGTLMATGIGDNFSQIVYPGPTYEVQWEVTDAFTNTSLIAEFYTFVDGLAPNPYCRSGLISEITPGNRFVRVTADAFDLGSFDNCTDQVNLVKRLWHRVLNIPRPTTTEEVLALPTFLELGCFFVGTQEIEFYVMDEAGNFANCTTSINIQNNMFSCSRRAISGALMDQKGLAIEAVEIEVNSTDSNLSLVSDEQGYFEFSMPDGADYTIRPIKNDDPLNGVSTYDLVLMSQHILGVKPFDSPYQYVAADVNKSGTITAFDLVQTRQLILNITTQFPNNNSWRFVDMDYEFANVAAGMNLNEEQEEKTIRNLSGDRLGMDFLGVKIGDINGSAVPNRSAPANGRSKNGTFTLITDNQLLEKGKTYIIPFYGKGFETISGYQFTLAFPFLKLLHITGGMAQEEHFGRTMEHRGILTTSWHSLQSRETTTALFSLTFQATKAGYLNELLTIASKHTPAEAYSFGGNLLNVSLAFSEPSPIPFMVYQNTPNPFSEHTNIGFDLPTKGNVLLQLVNSQGQIVHQQEGSFQRGFNEMRLNTKQLPAGQYYYQIASPFGAETKKMVKGQ